MSFRIFFHIPECGAVRNRQQVVDLQLLHAATRGRSGVPEASSALRQSFSEPLMEGILHSEATVLIQETCR